MRDSYFQNLETGLSQIKIRSFSSKLSKHNWITLSLPIGIDILTLCLFLTALAQTQKFLGDDRVFRKQISTKT